MRGNTHDYVYYPNSWTDTSTGTFYERGYYDEAGKHYENVAIKKKDMYETICCCDYCGTSIKLNWKEGAIPSCPNCGALLSNITQNTFFDTELQDRVVTSPFGSSFGNIGVKTVLGTIAAFCFLPYLSVGGMGLLGLIAPFLPDETDATTVVTTQTEQNTDESSIYVDVLGRECDWYDEYESYYDEVTDCYFVFNTDVEPPEWQYWYEGISSDYGDYGWMAYHYDEGLWYIESSDGQWDVLPDRYDTADLWHMNEEGTGKYNGQDMIHVTSIDRDCEWIPEEEAYYDQDTDCYFLYNDYVEPPVWHYWYGGISDAEEFNGYGWMEYDFDEDRWYIETSNGWELLPDSYDTTDLWYIE